MEPTRTVRSDSPDNDSFFRDTFFRRFALRPHTLELEGGVTKTYPFPTFYADVGCSIGIFFCDYAAAERLMPHPLIKPVRMPRGRTLVIFSCYEYRHVMRVWPYNEIAMSIPVMANASFSPPVLPMLVSDAFKRFGYYVFGMPVTSRENQLRGNKLWGLPKLTQAIDIASTNGVCTTVAKGDDGAPYFTLRVPTSGKATLFDVRGHLYSKLDDRILKARTCFFGRFNVTKYMRTLLAPNSPSPRQWLELGAGKDAETLRSLRIEPHPFQFRYAQSMSACFDLPIDGFDIGQ